MSRYAEIPWHCMTVEETEQALKSDRSRGVSQKIARRRRERLGENTLFCAAPTSLYESLSSLLGDVAWLLLFAVVVIGCFFSFDGTIAATLCILAVSAFIIIVVNTKMKNIRKTMSDYHIPRAEIVRGGRRCYARADMLVPGDLICLHNGDILPADARLIFADPSFLVSTLRGVQDGKPQYDPPCSKNAEMTYPETDGTEALLRENMLYAGSSVKEGYALAFVVAIAGDTYHGRLNGERSLVAQPGEMSYLHRIRRYVHRYSLLMCALLLPATAIGCLVGQQMGIYPVFLTVLSLVAASMSEQMMLLGRMVAACGVVRAALPSERGAAAVIKNESAMETLANTKEIFLFGRNTISDGKWHPRALVTAEKLYRRERFASDGAARLKTLAYLYATSRKTVAAVSGATVPSATRRYHRLLQGVEEMLVLSKLDMESIDIRTLSAKMAPDSSGDALVSFKNARGKVEETRILCSSQASLVLACDALATDTGYLPMDEVAHQKLSEQIRALHDEGCELLFYATRTPGRVAFEGMIALSEDMDLGLLDGFEQLNAHGVRATIFLPELTAYDRALLCRGGLLEEDADVVSGTETERLYDAYRDTEQRIFVGFSAQQVSSLVQKRRSEGSVCATVGIYEADMDALDTGDVMFAFDDTPFRSDRLRMPAKPRVISSDDENPRKSLGSFDTARYRADALLRPVSFPGSAFLGIVGAVRSTRGVEKNIALIMQYLQFSCFLRMAVLLLPLLFGRLAMTAPLLLFSGLWVDLLFALLLALRRGGEEELRAYPRRTLRVRPDRIIASLITGGLLLLVSLFFSGTDGKRTLFLFLSLMAVQVTVLLVYRFGDDGRSLRGRLPVLGVVLLICAPIVLLLCIPSVASAFGCTAVTLPMLGSCLLGAVLYLVAELLLALFGNAVRDAGRNIRSANKS